VTATFIGDQALATNCVRLSVLHVLYFQRKKNGSLIILTFYQFVNRNPRIACTCIWACPSSTQRHHCRSHHQAKEVVRTTLHVMFHYRNCEKLGQQSLCSVPRWCGRKNCIHAFRRAVLPAKVADTLSYLHSLDL
jgi:hypothetical protein